MAGALVAGSWLVPGHLAGDVKLESFSSPNSIVLEPDPSVFVPASR